MQLQGHIKVLVFRKTKQSTKERKTNALVELAIHVVLQNFPLIDNVYLY
jgi:hypothetical protein